MVAESAVRSALRGIRKHGKAIVLTKGSKVLAVTAVLRNLARCDKLIIGSLPQDEWMLLALDVVVASPDEELLDTLLPAQRLIVDSELSLPLPKVGVRNMTRLHIPAAAAIQGVHELRLPDAFHKPGLDDAAFSSAFSCFEQGLDVGVDDIAGVVALLLACLRAMADSSTSELLIIAPPEKQELLADIASQLLLHLRWEGVGVFVKEHELERQDVQHRILIRSPEQVEVVSAQRMLLVEADAYSGQVENLLMRIPTSGVQVGFQSGGADASLSMGTDVSDAMSGLGRRPALLPKRERSLLGVRHYNVEVEDEQHKVELLKKLWQEMRLVFARVAVFCNSRQAVEKLSEEMAQSGVAVCATHEGLCDEELKQRLRSRQWNMLVTSVDSADVCEVINFELPERSCDYAPRVWQQDPMGSRCAINFVAGEGDQLLLRSVEEEHGATMRALPEEGILSAVCGVFYL